MMAASTAPAVAPDSNEMPGEMVVFLLGLLAARGTTGVCVARGVGAALTVAIV